MRHPQQVSSDSIFKKCADSTRSTRVRCGCTCIKAPTTDDCVTLPRLEELKTASATALPDSEASLERKPQEALCLHQQVVSPQQVPVVCLPYWCQYHAVTSVSYMYFPSPCSARTCTKLWVGWMFFL